MNMWEAVFSQSPANEGYYNGERLPQAHWGWPQGTWFQSRLDRIRENERVTGSLKTSRKLLDTSELRSM
ncbi:MAG TPA: hypothetical protein VHV54_00700 [Candidatus Binatia bacterium]|nr:hypothetical protein [Candidatus Binatia bacterium]